MRALALASLLLAACSQDVPIELSFPSDNFFLFSAVGRVVVFQDTACSVALSDVQTGNIGEDALFDSGLVPVCDLRGGGITVSPMPAEPATYAAVTFDEGGVLLTTDCEQDKDARSEPRILLIMNSTEDYRDLYEFETPPCTTATQKCEGTCAM